MLGKGLFYTNKYFFILNVVNEHVSVIRQTGAFIEGGHCFPGPKTILSH